MKIQKAGKHNWKSLPNIWTWDLIENLFKCLKISTWKQFHIENITKATEYCSSYMHRTTAISWIYPMCTQIWGPDEQFCILLTSLKDVLCSRQMDFDRISPLLEHIFGVVVVVFFSSLKSLFDATIENSSHWCKGACGNLPSNCWMHCVGVFNVLLFIGWIREYLFGGILISHRLLTPS